MSLFPSISCKPLVTTLLLAFVGLSTTGCFQSTIRVAVKPDGSGTIAVSQTFDYETIDYLRGELTREAAIQELFSTERIKRNGEAYGKNVSMLITKPTNKPNGMGYLALYRFDHIKHIKIPIGKKGEHIKFDYSDGAITAFMPAQPKGRISNKPLPSTKQNRDQALISLREQLQQNGNPYQLRGNEDLDTISSRLLDNLQVSVELDLPPGTDISAAKFTHAQKTSRVTLISFEGKTIATNPEALKQLLTPSATPSDLLAAPGVIMEPKRELRFQLP